MTQLVPQHTDELLQRIDQPLELRQDSAAGGREFVACDYNRDGESLSPSCEPIIRNRLGEEAPIYVAFPPSVTSSSAVRLSPEISLHRRFPSVRPSSVSRSARRATSVPTASPSQISVDEHVRPTTARRRRAGRTAFRCAAPT